MATQPELREMARALEADAKRLMVAASNSAHSEQVPLAMAREAYAFAFMAWSAATSAKYVLGEFQGVAPLTVEEVAQ